MKTPYTIGVASIEIDSQGHIFYRSVAILDCYISHNNHGYFLHCLQIARLNVTTNPQLSFADKFRWETSSHLLFYPLVSLQGKEISFFYHFIAERKSNAIDFGGKQLGKWCVASNLGTEKIRRDTITRVTRSRIQGAFQKFQFTSGSFWNHATSNVNTSPVVTFTRLSAIYILSNYSVLTA